MARYTLLFLAAAATSVLAQWEDSCAPSVTAYECDKEDGGYTTTTITYYPTGCPSYKDIKWPAHKTWTTTAAPKATWDVVVDDKPKTCKGKDGKDKPCPKKCSVDKDGKYKDSKGKDCKYNADDKDYEEWEEADVEEVKVCKDKDGKVKPCPKKCSVDKDGKYKDSKGKECKYNEDDKEWEEWEEADVEEKKTCGKDKYGKYVDGKGKPCKPVDGEEYDWEEADVEEDKKTCNKDKYGKYVDGKGKPCPPPKKPEEGKKTVYVTFTEEYEVPCSTGWATSTSTVYKAWCGCSETPKPTKPSYDVYTTECPDAWGVGKTVTVTVPKGESTWADASVAPVTTWAPVTATTTGKSCGYTTTAIVSSSCSSWAEWDVSKTGKQTCTTYTKVSTVYPTTCTGTWATWATPVDASSTWATVAMPTGYANANATWNPVGVWKGAASSTRSNVFVVVAGAIAGVAYLL